MTQEEINKAAMAREEYVKKWMPNSRVIVDVLGHFVEAGKNVDEKSAHQLMTMYSENEVTLLTYIGVLEGIVFREKQEGAR